MKCQYPYCTQEFPHSILTCPGLHQRCEVCFQRGHSKSDAVCADLLLTFNVFEDYADQGLATSLRRADPAWGQWSIKGWFLADIIRKAGYYSLVLEGPGRVADLCRVLTNTFQRSLSRDFPLKKALRLPKIVKVRGDSGSRVGWTLGNIKSSSPLITVPLPLRSQPFASSTPRKPKGRKSERQADVGGVTGAALSQRGSPLSAFGARGEPLFVRASSLHRGGIVR